MIAHIFLRSVDKACRGSIISEAQRTFDGVMEAVTQR